MKTFISKHTRKQHTNEAGMSCERVKSEMDWKTNALPPNAAKKNCLEKPNTSQWKESKIKTSLNNIYGPNVKNLGYLMFITYDKLYFYKNRNIHLFLFN